MHSDTIARVPEKTRLPYLLAVAILVVIAGLSYGAFYAPAIYSDDWTLVVERFANGGAWIDWTSARPLVTVPFGVLLSVFGLNINALYIVLVGLNVIAAIQLFLLARRFMPDRPITALAVGAIFLVYPVIYIRMWLTFINYMVVVCLVFLYGSLLDAYLQGGRWYALIGALLCVVVSLGMVEGPLGIVLAWCVLLCLIRWKAAWQRKVLALAGPASVSILFAVWRARLAFQPDTTAGYAINRPFTPASAIHGFMLGLKVLIWGWSEPIRQASGLGKNSIALAALLLAIVACCFATAIVIGRTNPKRREAREPGQWDLYQARPVVALLAIGLALALAGFVPVLVVFDPNLSSMLSRVNVFAVPGASIVAVAGLNAIALIWRRNRRQAEILIGAAAIPLIIVGGATQAWVQYNTRVAWTEQRHIWADLLELAPNLADDTTVYFVLPGYTDRVGFANWQRIPLQGDWDTTSALKVLYNNSSLRGDVIYPDIETPVEPTLTEKGIVHYWEGKVTPYDRALFVAYDGNLKRLRVLENLQTELALSWPTPTFAPFRHIVAGPLPQVEPRKLVSQ